VAGVSARGGLRRRRRSRPASLRRRLPPAATAGRPPAAKETTTGWPAPAERSHRRSAPPPVRQTRSVGCVTELAFERPAPAACTSRMRPPAGRPAAQPAGPKLYLTDNLSAWRSESPVGHLAAGSAGSQTSRLPWWGAACRRVNGPAPPPPPSSLHVVCTGRPPHGPGRADLVQRSDEKSSLQVRRGIARSKSGTDPS
jgi:hypothetical protein